MVVTLKNNATQVGLMLNLQSYWWPWLPKGFWSSVENLLYTKLSYDESVLWPFNWRVYPKIGVVFESQSRHVTIRIQNIYKIYTKCVCISLSCPLANIKTKKNTYTKTITRGVSYLSQSILQFRITLESLCHMSWKLWTKAYWLFST